ncbi:MAG: GNAT family N-acetyltransferase [Rectinemataceae bacterium]
MWLRQDCVTEACRTFLLSHEESCIAVAEAARACAAGTGTRYRLMVHLPPRGLGGHEDSKSMPAASAKIDGVAVYTPAASSLRVILPEDHPECDQLLNLLGPGVTPRLVAGKLQDVRSFVPLLEPTSDPGWGWELQIFRFMLRLQPVEPFTTAMLPDGVNLRRAQWSDRKSLLSLEAAYEREEMGFDVSNRQVTDHVAHMMEQQIVLVAERKGVCVGKINTNARGYLHDQIGGFYVQPAHRGAGIGQALLEALTGMIERSGRIPALFVRQDNVPALALYRKTGFADAGLYAVFRSVMTGARRG